MAKIIGGPFGLISGKLGNRVYYIVNGQQRSRIAGRQMKPPTPKQLANMSRMKVTFEFAKTMGLFLEMGFGPEAAVENMQPRNAAVRYIRRRALKGEYPDIEIDYAKLLLSRGWLPGLLDAGVSGAGDTDAGLLLRYYWTVDLKDSDWPRCNDQVMLMAYCPEVLDADERACFKLTGARRIAGEDVLEVPLTWAGKAVEVYISVISEDRKSVADSQYLGKY